MHHLEKTRKRVTGASLSQHLGKSVALLGEFVQLEPNGQVLTLKSSSSDVVTVQLQQPVNDKMRALTIRPDDTELFRNVANDETKAFFLSNLSAFKKMWTDQGRVYWLRFLVTFKHSYDHWASEQEQLNFVFEMDEDELIMSHLYTSIHKKFVLSSYNGAKTFLENIFAAVKHMPSLLLKREKNPHYNKEAFDAIFGKSDIVDKAPIPPFPLIVFASTMYTVFVGSVCALLKRWLKEPDMSEKAKKGIDFTYFYWKPEPDWYSDCYWASCFENYLADTYKDELPKMLLTSNIQNFFKDNHNDDCPCHNYGEDMNVFDLFEEIEKTNENKDFCIKHLGIIKPNILSCTEHKNCYQQIVHDINCREPYLCEGSKDCNISCETTLQNCPKNNLTLNKCEVEIFRSKEPKKNRHVSTYAETDKTFIKTFVHGADPVSLEIASNHCEDREFMIDLMHDPEMMNSFNQHKRKEDYKNKLRMKFREKYGISPKDFDSPAFRLSLFEAAQKKWCMELIDEGCFKMNRIVYDKNNVFNSKKNVATTVAVGTSNAVCGRIVSPSHTIAEATNTAVPMPDASGTKSKSKKKKKKNKHKSNSNDVGSSSTTSIKKDVVSSSTTSTKKDVIYVLEEKSEVRVKQGLESPSSTSSTGVANQESSNSSTQITTISKDSSSNNTANQSNDTTDSSTNFKDKAINKDTNLTITERPNKVDTIKSSVKILPSVNEIKHLKGNKVKAVDNIEDSSQLSNESSIVPQSLPSEISSKATKDVMADLQNKNLQKDSEKQNPQKEICNEVTGSLLINSVESASGNNTLDEIEGANELTFNGEEDKTVEDFFKLIGVINKPIPKDETNPDCEKSVANIKDVAPPLDKKLKTCAFCGKKEVTYKTFKRCARCKADNFPVQLYYCSRQCQVDDWQESHRDEHARKGKQ